MDRFCSWSVAKTCSNSSFSGPCMEENERRNKKSREKRERHWVWGVRDREEKERKGVSKLQKCPSPLFLFQAIRYLTLLV